MNPSAAQMDLPVEAMVHLDLFSYPREVERILRSRGFELTDRNGSEVRIRGYFSQLRIVKAQLEQLQRSSVLPSDRGSARSKQRPRQPHPDGAAGSQEQESFFSIGEDVFIYADQFKKSDIIATLNHHHVSLCRKKEDDCFAITVTGRESEPAATALKSLFSELQQFLRTQDVPRERISRDGFSLLRRTHRDMLVYKSVLVVETREGLHLIGPSKESFNLQEKLLKGSTFGRGQRWRSSSLPSPTKLKHMARQSAAADDTAPPGGAAGYTPPKNSSPGRGVKPEGAKPLSRSHTLFHRRKKHSESPQENAPPQKENDSTNSLMKRLKDIFQIRGSTKGNKPKGSSWKWKK